MHPACGDWPLQPPLGHRVCLLKSPNALRSSVGTTFCAHRSGTSGALFDGSPVQNYKRIFQTGWQQCSDKNFRRAGELVRNGRIGKLHTVRCSLPGGRPDYGKTGDHKATKAVPQGFDYYTWLGPT